MIWGWFKCIAFIVHFISIITSGIRSLSSWHKDSWVGKKKLVTKALFWQDFKCWFIHLFSVKQSCPTLVTPWTVAHQAPLSMGFSRQEYWSVLPFPPPGKHSVLCLPQYLVPGSHLFSSYRRAYISTDFIFLKKFIRTQDLNTYFVCILCSKKGPDILPTVCSSSEVLILIWNILLISQLWHRAQLCSRTHPKSQHVCDNLGEFFSSILKITYQMQHIIQAF